MTWNVFDKGLSKGEKEFKFTNKIYLNLIAYSTGN
jgi:hypothetical protein